MPTSLRFRVIENAFLKRPVEVKLPDERPSEYFGKYVRSEERRVGKECRR